MRTLAPVILSLTLVLAGPLQADDDQHHQKVTAASAPAGQMMMQGGAMKCPLGGAYAEGTLAFLKAELRIAPAQGPAWDAFAKAYLETVSSQNDPKGGAAVGGPAGHGAMMSKPFPEHIAAHNHMMERRLTATKKLQAVVDPLYAALDPKQKKTADELLPMIFMMTFTR